VEHLDRDPEPLGEALGAARDDHELLEVERVACVHAAVDYVQHRHREDMGVAAADPAIQRHAGIRSRGLGGRKRDAENGVCPETALVVGAVEGDERRVDPPLILRIHPLQRRRDLHPHVVDGAEHALAEIRASVAVAQLDCLELPCRGSGWNRRPPDRTGLQHDVDLNRRVAAGVEDLTGTDVGDR
jgi:hypothetical protein